MLVSLNQLIFENGHITINDCGVDLTKTTLMMLMVILINTKPNNTIELDVRWHKIMLFRFDCNQIGGSGDLRNSNLKQKFPLLLYCQVNELVQCFSNSAH